MICPIKYKNNINQKGFSLIEILVVLGILAVIAAVSGSVYFNFRARGNLDLGVNTVVESLRYAKEKSEIGLGDATWGVKIWENSLDLVKDGNQEETISLPQGVNLESDLSEIIFEKIVGNTDNAGTIKIYNNYGEKEILINKNGTINY